jgi:proline iminopeptidase
LPWPLHLFLQAHKQAGGVYGQCFPQAAQVQKANGRSSATPADPMKRALFLLGLALPAQVPLSQIQHAPGAFVTINHAKIWYETEGTGEPVILISGGPGSSHNYFHPFLSDLAGVAKVVYFDAFGRGKSDRAASKSEYTFARDVSDLEALRSALGFETITLLGHSYGGMVAEAYAIKYPSRVKRLILADTFYNGEMWQANNDSCNRTLRNQSPEVWAKVMELRRQGLHSSAKAHQDAYQLPVGLLYFHDASKAKLLWDDPSNNDVYYAIAGDDADFLIGGDIAAVDFRLELQQLKMPVLVIAGRYDRVSIPRWALEFKRYIPHAEFKMFEESGHSPFVEEPGAFVDAVRDFLRK